MNQDILKLYKSFGSTQNNKMQSRNVQTSALTASIISHPSTSNDFSNLKRPSEFVIESLSKRKREKCSKGLRHFSMKVCEKVKQKNITTYNEVADELVQESCNYSNETNQLDYWSYDQKNVRRRVYDALNVLMAMNIISKEKKEIKWIGLPCNKKQECQELEIEKQKKAENIKLKCEQLRELILEHIAFKALIERNKQISLKKANQHASTIKLPFILVDTDRKTVIDCNISTDKKEYAFNFDNTFQLSNHIDMLKRIGLTMGFENGKCENEDFIQKSFDMTPNLFRPYIRQMATRTELTPIIESTNLPNFKNLNKSQNDSNYLKNNLDDINDMNDYTSADEQVDYSGDSDESDSDDHDDGDGSSG